MSCNEPPGCHTNAWLIPVVCDLTWPTTVPLSLMSTTDSTTCNEGGAIAVIVPSGGPHRDVVYARRQYRSAGNEPGIVDRCCPGTVGPEGGWLAQYVEP